MNYIIITTRKRMDAEIRKACEPIYDRACGEMVRLLKNKKIISDKTIRIVAKDLKTISHCAAIRCKGNGIQIEVPKRKKGKHGKKKSKA